MQRQARQTVIITGGNTGLGPECAREIARSDGDWHIVLAGRDERRNSQAAGRLATQTGSPNIEAMVLDLASLASVRSFVKQFAARNLPPLRAIVCNAGIQVTGALTYTGDGFETMFAVNHLGHFLLVNLLLEQLQAPAKIVFVSSGTHDAEQPEKLFGAARYTSARELATPDTAAADPFRGIGRYATSKLLNILCAYELHRRMQAAGLSSSERPIAVLAYDPGAVPETSLARGYHPVVQAVWRSRLLRRSLELGGAVFSDPRTSGRAMARLVLDPALMADSACYFRVWNENRSSRDSYNLAYARDLWETSVVLAELQQYETALGEAAYA